MRDTKPLPPGLARSLALCVLTAAIAATTAHAQVPTTPLGRELSLEQAVAAAQDGNSAFRMQANDLLAADWEVRSAYAQLFPGASVGGGFSWQGRGDQQLGNLTTRELGFGGQRSFLFSSYSLGLSWSLNGQKLLAPGEAKARRTQTEYRNEAGLDQLVLRVTQAYLDALRQSEEITLAEAQLERARYNLQLARAHQEVGAGLALDTRRAEVEVGRAEVTVLQARNSMDVARVTLFREMGVEYDESVRLSTSFPLEAPAWEIENLTGYALAANPAIRELYAGRESAAARVRMARSQYFPSLSISAGWSGFTREARDLTSQEEQLLASAENARLNCLENNDLRSRLTPPLPALDCSGFVVTEADLALFRQANDQFPFDFTRSPPSVSLSLTLPIFQGLTRKRDVESAQVAREDAREQLRGQEMAVRADVRITLGNVRTAYQSALIAERNRDLADEQLRLARERFAVGELAFAELADSETGKAQADRDLLAAIYAYHDAVALLESIVGVALR